MRRPWRWVERLRGTPSARPLEVAQGSRGAAAIAGACVLSAAPWLPCAAAEEDEKSMPRCRGRRIVSVESLALLLVLTAAPGVVGAAEPESILIRNVRLIDRTGQTEDRRVNLLIKETKLHIVTTDEIELEDGLIGCDAQNGIVMGVLDIGQPASFLIVDQDPREDIEVLLDTRTHVVFAIRQGTIFRNTLPRVAALEPDPEEKKKPRWIAYTPPPMALPLSYQDTTKWNRWETRPISGIFVAAVALDRHRWLTQDVNSQQQVGDLEEYDGGEIRAFRVGVAGTLNFKRP
jgi:phosphate-selective porin OprO/OprP